MHSINFSIEDRLTAVSYLQCTIQRTARSQWYQLLMIFYKSYCQWGGRYKLVGHGGPKGPQGPDYVAYIVVFLGISKIICSVEGMCGQRPSCLRRSLLFPFFPPYFLPCRSPRAVGTPKYFFPYFSSCRSPRPVGTPKYFFSPYFSPCRSPRAVGTPKYFSPGPKPGLGGPVSQSLGSGVQIQNLATLK